MSEQTTQEMVNCIPGFFLLAALLLPAWFKSRRPVSGNKSGVAWEQDELYAELFDDLEEDL